VQPNTVLLSTLHYPINVKEKSVTFQSQILTRISADKGNSVQK